MGDPKCGMCHRGTEANNVCGQLYTSKDCTAHLKCMQYSAGLVQYRNKLGFGGFKPDKVKNEIARGNKLKCTACKDKKKALFKGASSGCAVGRCSKSFHFYCAEVGKATITRRMEVMVPQKDGKKRKMVEYRVFCSGKHQDVYQGEKAKQKQYIRKPKEESGSDDDASDEEEMSGDVTHLAPVEIETDSSSNDDDNEPPNVDDETLDSSDEDFETLKKRAKNSPAKKSGSVRKGKVTRGRTSLSEATKRKAARSTEALSADADSESDDEVSFRTSPRKKQKRSRDDKDDSGSEPEQSRRKSSRASASAKKRQAMAEAPEEDATSVTSGSNSHSSLKNAIGTLTPLTDRNGKKSNSSGSASRKKLSYLNQIEEAAQAVQKAVDLSKRPGEVIAKLDPNKDMLLCFVESTDIGSTLEQKLKKFASKMYNIPPGSLYINKYPGFQMTAEHVAYLLKDLTNTLRMSELDEFRRLVLELKEEDISKYNYIIQLNNDYPEQLAETVYSKLRESIRDNIETASNDLGKTVGWYCRVQHREEQIRVALVALSGHTDSSGDIRRTLRNRSEIFQWRTDTKLDPYLKVTEADQFEEEFVLLKKWLGMMEGSLIDHRPRDSILFKNVENSLALRLFAHFKVTTVFQQTTSRLVFIRPMESKIVNLHEYMKELVTGLLTDPTNSNSSIVFIIDLREDEVDVDADILPHIPSEIRVTLLSAFNPEVKAISCMLIKLDMEIKGLEKYEEYAALADTTRAKILADKLQNGEDATSQELTVPHTSSGKLAAPPGRSTDDTDEAAACQVTAIEIPKGAVYFLPPDLKWRLVQCNDLGLSMQSITSSTVIQSKVPTHLGRPSLTQKIKGDGNCFFRAISQQITGSQNQHYQLRKLLIRYMIKREDAFSKFFNIKNVKLHLDMNRMGDDSTWATDTEIIAMASLLDTQIVIYTPVARVYKWLPYSPIGKSASYKCKVYLVNRKYHFDLVLAVADKKVKKPGSQAATTGDDDDDDADAKS